MGVFAALVMMLSAAVPAQAAQAAVWLFLTADGESQGNSIRTDQTASRAGVVATVTRHGAGSYTVSITNAGSLGIPVVTAVNKTGVHCQLRSFHQDDDATTEIVEVSCYKGTTSTNSRFTLSFFASTPPDSGATGAYGYVHDDQPTMASYTPVRGYNSTGEPVLIKHTAGSNLWTVRFSGQSFDSAGGNMQVSAVGTVPARCAIVGWSAIQDAPGTEAQVRCDKLSAATQTPQWTLVYAQDRSITGGTDGFFGYLQADQATPPISPPSPPYTPSLPRNRAATATYTHTVTRSGTGQYQAQVYGPLKDLVDVHVSVNGNTGGFCDIKGSTVTPSTQPAGLVDIACYNASGAPANNVFSLNYYAP
jgi:hypothetical protein